MLTYSMHHNAVRCKPHPGKLVPAKDPKQASFLILLTNLLLKQSHPTFINHANEVHRIYRPQDKGGLSPCKSCS